MPPWTPRNACTFGPGDGSPASDAGLLVAAEAEPLQNALEIAAIEAGGARHRAHVARVACDLIAEVARLELGERALTLRKEPARRRRGILGFDLAASRLARQLQHHALDRVAQLAHVARPG